MRRSQLIVLSAGVVASLFLLVAVALVARAGTNDEQAFLPVVRMPEPTITPNSSVEFRGLWVTRWDWAPGATEATIDAIVDDAARAGFNVLLFQVRGAADAYYASSIEPWGRLLTGNLGGNPGFDPLSRMINKAHARGIEVHAYINVYTLWDKCTFEAQPPRVSPEPLYYQLKNDHGQQEPGTINNGLQWDTNDNTICRDGYLWATPASVFADTHYLAVARDLANRYEIDGIHLDRVRYAGRSSSCDPVSEAVTGVSCFQNPDGYASYADFQRVQVNGTVRKYYNMIAQEHPDLMLSAAVWFTYQDKWDWGYSQGYHDYYQDSQGWMKGNYIDAIMPMIYSSNPETFPQWKWRTLVSDFVDNSNGRFVVAGIGSNHYDSFSEIEARIQIGRQLGTAGHAIFSYSGMKQKGYFDLLASGPYAEPALVPRITWHN
jgi:uncharacterized lipoprotein YddW (UPF0748 family)